MPSVADDDLGQSVVPLPIASNSLVDVPMAASMERMQGWLVEDGYGIGAGMVALSGRRRQA